MYGNMRESRAHGYIGILCTHVCIMDDGDYSDFGSTGGVFFRPNRPDRPGKTWMREVNECGISTLHILHKYSIINRNCGGCPRTTPERT